MSLLQYISLLSYLRELFAEKKRESSRKQSTIQSFFQRIKINKVFFSLIYDF